MVLSSLEILGTRYWLGELSLVSILWLASWYIEISCLVKGWFVLILLAIRFTLWSVTIPLSIKVVHSFALIVFIGFASCARFLYLSDLGSVRKKSRSCLGIGLMLLSLSGLINLICLLM